MCSLDTRPPSLGSADQGDPFAQFRCDHPREVLSLLLEMRDGVTPVALSGPGGANLGATVLTVDGDRQRLAFDVEAGDPQLPALVEANEVTAVAYLESVKLQFDLQDLVLVRSARATALQSRLPRCIYRFQRRSAYRVRPLDRSAPVARIRHPALPDMMLSLRIMDVSIGGCALLLPAGLRGPAFVVTSNYRVIRSYNNSAAYMLGVALLSDRIAGAGPLAGRWPTEDKPLSTNQAMDIQRHLQRLGYPVGKLDGRLGEQAQTAIRAYQSRSGLVADGYANQALLEQMKKSR